jgi:hypothetical protein
MCLPYAFATARSISARRREHAASHRLPVSVRLVRPAQAGG